MHKRVDVYQAITDKIIRELESGHAPWLKPWSDTKAARASGGSIMPRNAFSGRYYQGINILSAWLHMELYKLDSINPMFMTYEQARKGGGYVKRGEKACLMVAFNKTVKREKQEDGTITLEPRLYAIAHNVFHIGQTEGVNVPALDPAKAPKGLESDQDWQEYVAACKVDLRHGGTRAFYNRKEDYVQMPTAEAFKGPEQYKATALHELVHWTGHNSRLGREFGKRFGDEAYAFEELCAEMGAAFLCADLGVEHAELRHTAYIASWLKVLRENNRAIVQAASAASKAAVYLGAIARGEDPSASAEGGAELEEAA